VHAAYARHAINTLLQYEKRIESPKQHAKSQCIYSFFTANFRCLPIIGKDKVLAGKMKRRRKSKSGGCNNTRPQQFSVL